jgi:acetyl esterase
MPRLLRLLAFILLLAAAGFAAIRLSPWPSVLVIRHFFDSDAAMASAALQKHLPQGLTEHLNLTYDPDSRPGTLDVFLPPGPVPTGGWPVVVWVHGGAWVSGSKENVANYLRILAGRGFATVGVGYTLAPTAHHPGPARQVNIALGWLNANGPALGLDMTRTALAGDSAGAQIAAQTGIVLTDPAYATRLGIAPALKPGQLRGLVLFCGGYDIATVDFDGAFGGFLKTVLWAYFGTKDFARAPDLPLFSIPQNLPAAMPPMFLSAGNADPLGPQSVQLAERAATLGIRTDTLFFPADHAPLLGHEYQFDLDIADGRTALDRASAFLNRVFTLP